MNKPVEPQGRTSLIEIPQMKHLTKLENSLVPRVPDIAHGFNYGLLLSQIAYRIRNDKTGKLAACTDDSWAVAVTNCCLLGLMPGYAGEKTPEVYFVAYGKHINADPSYRGMQVTLMRTGMFKTFASGTVYEGDHFERWIDPVKGHGFTYKDGLDHSVIKGHFSWSVNRDGWTESVYMTKPEMEEHEENSRQGNGPMKDTWKKWPRQMGEKVVIKTLCKKMPLITQHDLVNQAMIIDVENEQAIEAATDTKALAQGMK